MVKIKRVYDPPEENDGLRILVDRLCPRGLTRSQAKIDIWLKEISPSSELRKMFGHQEARWEKFRKPYFKELNQELALVQDLLAKASRQTVTLLFAAKDREKNNAVVLREYLETQRQEK
jgi:uncharacterized protein YeaO (DUF488 family)